ncbi:MAG TPA: hypothetical protein VEK73_20590, partial [Xanthobacteraceae bacterium]|nr:hypothetical protein [Xanthobacteraceae bacterium]
MAGFERQARAARVSDAIVADGVPARAIEEADAQRRLDLLRAVVDLLPVGVRVDSADGRLILA